MRRVPLLLLSSVLAAVLGALVAAVAAAPAWAHTRLVSSVPSQDAPAEAPDEVVLVFSEPVQPALSALSVKGADGEEHVSGTPSPGGDGSSVSQPLHAPLEPGTYAVAYRVLAADGHPVTGSFRITSVAPAGAPAPAASTSEPAPVPTTRESTGALSPAAGEREDGGLPVLPLLAVGLVLAGAAGLLASRLGGPAPHA